MTRGSVAETAADGKRKISRKWATGGAAIMERTFSYSASAQDARMPWNCRRSGCFRCGCPGGRSSCRGRRRRAFCGERRRGGCRCQHSCWRESGCCSPTGIFRTLRRMRDRHRNGKARLRPMRLFSIGFRPVPRGTGPWASWVSPVSLQPCFSCPSSPRKSLFSPRFLLFSLCSLWLSPPHPPSRPPGRRMTIPPNALLLRASAAPREVSPPFFSG